MHALLDYMRSHLPIVRLRLEGERLGLAPGPALAASTGFALARQKEETV